MENRPKYSLLEIERRWLADREKAGDLDGLPHRTIEDHYLTTSRLRLRRINEPGKGTIFKLTKKYGKCTPLSEALTNLYLTEDEYHLLRRLPGSSAVKQRYPLSGGSLDIYCRPNDGLAVFEVEFDNEGSAILYEPPPFAVREVTDDEGFSGFSLADENTAH